MCQVRQGPKECRPSVPEEARADLGAMFHAVHQRIKDWRLRVRRASSRSSSAINTDNVAGETVNYYTQTPTQLQRTVSGPTNTVGMLFCLSLSFKIQPICKKSAKGVRIDIK
ncbi:potassium voltage-gated channel subfamily H member 6 [Trichonephila inaurata madagascariensis]|uniref:Potassium voltage-gated channel subfamily H member 6 n=1 Tax=Trichonephila inaurata madagascariensis TaxID=2747483 RepID=A0A8X6XTB5_9ARAC|nr:potassium voltage-gated channel subfamily H member 6 [Trichonephila inaurata madagascariensis]